MADSTSQRSSQAVTPDAVPATGAEERVLQHGSDSESDGSARGVEGDEPLTEVLITSFGRYR